MTHDIRIIRATADTARAVAEFLHQQDVRPAPREADVAALTGQDDAELVCALRHERIEGVAGYVKDGPAIRLAYFAAIQEREDLLAQVLLQALEAFARDGGAAVLAAQVLRDSQTHRCLMAYGFAAEWEEGDAAFGRAATTIDLVKPL